MESLVSEVSKRDIKDWKKLFECFLSTEIYELVQNQAKHLNGFDCFLMGLFHEQGFRVSKDYVIALRYFELGCLKRDPLCLYKLYELNSCKNSYGVNQSHETAMLYLIWSITFLMTFYGDYTFLDFDMELQYCYKIFFKKSRSSMFLLIQEQEDNIFYQDKSYVENVFGLLIEYIIPEGNYDHQKGYNKVVNFLLNMGEIKDPSIRIHTLFRMTL
jgi:hypothetical protein